MWNLGPFRVKWIYCQWLLNESSNMKFVLHICGTYNFDYLSHTTFRFYLINVQLNIYLPFQFCVFGKIVIQRSVFNNNKNAYKKSSNPSFVLCHKAIESDNCFTLIENNLFKIAKLESKVTFHYSLGQKTSSCDPLTYWNRNINAVIKLKFVGNNCIMIK